MVFLSGSLGLERKMKTQSQRLGEMTANLGTAEVGSMACLGFPAFIETYCAIASEERKPDRQDSNALLITPGSVGCPCHYSQ